MILLAWTCQKEIAMAQAKLILAANALGNPKDTPVRSLEAVAAADLVIFEDDREARRVLKQAGVTRDYRKLSEHEESDTLEAARQAFAAGKTVVYMSDQGTPNLCDPGMQLMEIAEEYSVMVSVIPGPSSLTTAVAACRFMPPNEGFYFMGLLPRDPGERLAALRKSKSLNCLKLVLETPYRLAALLDAIDGVFGATCQVFIAFDISGPEEEFFHGTTTEAKSQFTQSKNRRNFVLGFR